MRQVDVHKLADDARFNGFHGLVLFWCALIIVFDGYDLAVAGMATSVYIAGGIVPRVRDFLVGSAFHARFAERGVLRGVMERVPVRLIDDPHMGVIGAAAWYLQAVDGRTGAGTACA